MEDEKKVATTPKVKPEPAAEPAKEPTKNVDLKIGEVIIAPVGDEDNELKVTMNDWNRVYNAGKNAGNWILKAEKKS